MDIANGFKLVLIIVEKVSPFYRSKRVACVVSIAEIANIDCKYMNFCARNIYGSYRLAPRDLFYFRFGTNSKKTTDSVSSCKN